MFQGLLICSGEALLLCLQSHLLTFCMFSTLIGSAAAYLRPSRTLLSWRRGAAGLESLCVCVRLRALLCLCARRQTGCQVHRLLSKQGGDKPVILTYVVSEPPLLHPHVFTHPPFCSSSREGCLSTRRPPSNFPPHHTLFTRICTPFLETLNF